MFGLRNDVIVCRIITALVRLMLVGQVRNNHDKSCLVFAPLVGTPATRWSDRHTLTH